MNVHEVTLEHWSEGRLAALRDSIAVFNALEFMAGGPVPLTPCCIICGGWEDECQPSYNGHPFTPETR